MTEQTSTSTAATCKYPGCKNPPEPSGDKPGRPPEYCANTAHNPVSAWRERKRLSNAERGVTTTEAETEQPVTMARITGAEMLRQMRELAGTMNATAERLITSAATIGDPTAAEAEVESARAAAEQRAATAEAERAEAERRAATADQMRAAADEAAEEMSERLTAEQTRAREAHDRLAEVTAAQAVELERIRQDAQARITAAETERDNAIQAAEVRAQKEIEQAGTEARRLVQTAEEARNRALTDVQQAEQRAATAETRAERTTTEARDQIAQIRADAARERDELREVLDSRARALDEARNELRQRVERAEHDLDAARAELTQLRQESKPAVTPNAPKRQRTTHQTAK
jgi:chromosome segregation ATPase